MHAAGYRKVDAYSPYPIEELSEALGLPPLARCRCWCWAAASSACVGGYGLAVLGVGDRVPDEHRRPAAPQLARLHRPRPSRPRSCSPRSPRCSDAGPERPAEPYHPVFNVPALRARQRATASSSASRPRDPQFDLDGDAALPREPARRRPRSPRSSIDAARARSSAACLARPGRWPAAGRTCTTSRGTSRTRRATSSATSARRGRWSRARSRAGSCARTTRLYTGKVGRRLRGRRSRCRSTGALLQRGPRALRHLLHALPRPRRPRRRHGRAARLPQAAVVPRRPPARSSRRLLLRRDHQRLRRHARLRGPDPGRATAGRSWPTCARCSSARTRPLADVPADAARRARRAARPRRRAPAGTSLMRRPAGAAGRGPAPAGRARRRRAWASCCARVGWFSNAAQFFRSYLFAFLFWTGLALGCLSILLIHHLTGGMWGLVIRRLLEAGARTLPWSRAALPARRARACRSIYVWAQPEAVAHDPLLQHKAPYLNVPFFLARAAFYFVVWIAARALPQPKWSRELDAGRDYLHVVAAPARAWRGGGLLLMGLTITFSAVDWAMSLDPHWFSTIYGVLFMVGQVLSAMALMHRAAWRCWATSRRSRACCGREHGPRPRQADARLRHAVGLPQLLAVPDHLVGQPAGGDPLVHPARCTAAGSTWRWRSCSSTSRCRSRLLLSRDLKRNARTLALVAGAGAGGAAGRPLLAGRPRPGRPPRPAARQRPASALARPRGAPRRSAGSGSSCSRASSAAGRCCRWASPRSRSCWRRTRRDRPRPTPNGIQYEKTDVDIARGHEARARASWRSTRGRRRLALVPIIGVLKGRAREARSARAADRRLRARTGRRPSRACRSVPSTTGARCTRQQDELLDELRLGRREQGRRAHPDRRGDGAAWRSAACPRVRRRSPLRAAPPSRAGRAARSRGAPPVRALARRAASLAAGSRSRSAQERPTVLRDVGFDQRLGELVPARHRPARRGRPRRCGSATTSARSRSC